MAGERKSGRGGDRRRSDAGRQAGLGSLIEYSDVLSKPQEALLFDTNEIAMPVRPHWHYYMEIVYMLRGGMLIEIDGKTHLVRPGDFCMIRPEVVHCFFQHEGRRAQCEILKFDVSRLHSGRGYVPKLEVLLRQAGNVQQAPMYFPRSRIAGLRIGSTLVR